MAEPGSFDPEDRNSWYFGLVSREETNNILQAERDSGVFLVRDSTSIKGDFVVCVKEDNKVSHYIVNKITTGGSVRFRIGDQEFPTLPALLNFYKTHYLDTTSLMRPARRQKLIAKYKFEGKDPDDLPFEKDEILTLIRKDEEQWWTAQNSRGDIGLVPVPYVVKYTGNDDGWSSPNTEPVMLTTDLQSPVNNPTPSPPKQRKLPAMAVVIRNRDPNAYDKSALKLKAGDKILVVAMHMSGQWEGTINGQRGFFPFTHVQFVDSDSNEPEEAAEQT